MRLLKTLLFVRIVTWTRKNSSLHLRRLPLNLDSKEQEMKNRSEYIYQEATGLTRVISILLVLRIFAGFLSIAGGLMACYVLKQIQLQDNDAFRLQQLPKIQLAEHYDIYIFIPFTFITAIVFYVWLYRACKNAHSLSVVEPMPYGPGWSIGWFFVPIASLFMPYRVMSAIWNHSNPDETKETDKSGNGVISCWWFLWIVGAILGQVVNLVVRQSDGSYSFALKACLMASGVILINSLMIMFWLKMIKTIHRMQGQKHADMLSRLPICPGCGEPNQPEAPQCPLCGSPMQSPAEPVMTGPLGNEGTSS